MATNNGIISAPVSFADVQTTLGTADTSLDKLCTNAAINKWSKKKPVQQPHIFTHNMANWHVGKYGDFGISWAETTLAGLDTIESIFYIKPAGGIDDPYRLTDFNGYYHGAGKPVEFTYPDILYNNTGSAYFTFNLNADEKAVTLKDLFPSGLDDDWYVAVRIKGGGYTRYKTADVGFASTQSGNKDFIDIDLADDTNLSVFKSLNSIEVLPFICTTPLTTWGTFGTVGRYRSLDIAPITINIVQAPYTAKISATGSATMLTLSTIIISVTVTNISSSPVEFQWETIRYDKTDSNGTSLQNLTTDWKRSGNTLTSETIIAGDSKTATTTVSGSTQIVDFYTAVLNFRWYDGEYGYVQLVNLYAQYPD